jgi:hypothetical protein
MKTTDLGAVDFLYDPTPPRSLGPPQEIWRKERKGQGKRVLSAHPSANPPKGTGDMLVIFPHRDGLYLPRGYTGKTIRVWIAPERTYPFFASVGGGVPTTP